MQLPPGCPGNPTPYHSLFVSSGKYVEIRFGADDGSLLGAAVRTYLLERSRVVHVNDPERSYHIFYQVKLFASI